jgi:hypothetical protein
MQSQTAGIIKPTANSYPLQNQKRQAYHRLELIASAHRSVCLLRWALSSWAVCVAASAPRRDRLRAFACHLQQSTRLWTCTQAWQAWQELHHTLAVKQVQMGRAIVHCNLGLCRRSLIQWRGWTHERTQDRRKLQAALQHLAQRLCRQAMWAWQQYTHRQVCKLCALQKQSYRICQAPFHKRQDCCQVCTITR